MSPSRSQTPHRSLPVRVIYFFVFIALILKQVLVANIQLAKSVLFEPVAKLEPGFIVYPLEGLSKLEIFVLSHCITLTPGSTAVEISNDFRQLVVHSFGTGDPAAAVAGIRTGIEHPLLRWTR